MISTQNNTYLTTNGFRTLAAEMKNWLTVERPKIVEVVAWAAKNGDRSENGDYLYGKKRMREIDRRIGFLTRLLKAATVVDPSLQIQKDTVFFGARVTYINHDNNDKKTVQIVGTEEADPFCGLVNYQSPLARALLKKKLGDDALLQSPDGVEELEIIAIEYY